MARKGILSTALNSPAASAGGPKPKMMPRGAVGALQSSLSKLQESAVQEIDTALIEDAGYEDRLGMDGAAFNQLKDSLQTYGQQVPVLLRPHPKTQGRFEIVYGRRRLKALRELAHSGVKPQRIRRSLHELEGWWPDTDGALAQLETIEQEGDLFVRTREGSLAEPSGQLLLDFGARASEASNQAPEARERTESYDAVTNVGRRPTVAPEGAAPLVEVHLLDFDGDLYGQRVELEFVERLRPEKRFGGLEELRVAIAADVEAARARHAELRSAETAGPSTEEDS